jgi:hypothetical protein
MTVILNDTFGSINKSIWTNIYSSTGWLPNGTPGSTYNPANVTADSSGLHLAIKKESYNGYSYTGGGLGGLASQYQISQGRWEAKAKFPSCGSEKGVVGFILLMATGSDIPEIDFAETTGSDANTIILTQHSSSGTKTDTASGIDTTQWHTYTVDVWNNQVKFYIDGILKSTQTQNFTSQKLTVSMGTWTGKCSGYGGCPTNTSFPQSLDIAYVKIDNDASTPIGTSSSSSTTTTNTNSGSTTSNTGSTTNTNSGSTTSNTGSTSLSSITSSITSFFNNLSSEEKLLIGVIILIIILRR